MLSQHSIESQIEEVAIGTALQVIHDSDALVKTICSPLSDHQSWNEILPKLAKTQTSGKNESNYTEITATTLLPIDGKIRLFEPSNPKYKVMVGMLFDLKKCDIQYIFQKNVFSKDWLGKNESLIPPQVTVDQLRTINSQARIKGIVLENNEILAGLSTDSLVGIFSTKNDLFSRLNALAKQQLIKRSLNKILPVLIITPDEGVLIYDNQQQLRDIQKALSADEGNPVRILVENDIDIKQLKEASNLEVEGVTEKKSGDSDDQFLEKNKDFLTNENIPNELKVKVLRYFNLAELAKYAHEVAKGAEDKIIQDLIITEFNRKKANDLRMLISEIDQPIDVTTVSNIIRTETHDFSIIERAIIHLCYSNPQGAAQVLSDYLFQTSKPNPHIISTFLSYCTFLETKKRSKIVVYIEGGDNPWEYDPEIVVYMDKWSPLVAAILTNNPFIANLIVSHYPKHIPAMMQALNELQKISTNYPNNCDYSLDQITAAKKTLLLQLKQEHSKYYTLTYADKRLIEKHLFSEINHLQNRKSLHTFYQQHADSLYLNQHRHARYDNMRQKLFPRIKENILAALQDKSLQLSNDAGLPLSEKEKETLDSEILKLKAILQSKRDSLLKQERGVTFFLFYSTSRTDKKIKIIGESLEKLDTITHFSELRMFTENLLLNHELITRRSFGITASDTYVKLKEFYDKCFFVADSGSTSNKRQ